jgi:DNA topoisomerase-1
VALANLAAEVRIGQYGPFIAKEENGERLTASLPGDLPPAELTDEMVEQLLHQKSDGPRTLGADPQTDLPVLLKIGPFGPYVQLGEDDPKSKVKPKRASLLKGMPADGIGLEVALQLLALPRLLGEHPETGKPVQAGVGRFGPFVVSDGVYANLRNGEDVLTIDLERALALLAQKASRRRARAQCVQERDQGAGRAPKRRAGAGAERALWAVCQPRQGQLYHSKGDQAGGCDAGAGGGMAGGEGGEGAGQGPGQAHGERARRGEEECGG